MPNKSRTLIKLDDRVIEITQGKKGLLAKELTVDELCEVSILDEGVDKLIENDIHRLTNEAYEELKANFKDTLKGNTLKIVGFDNRWHNGWEVDHCNGRQSMLTEYMGSKVKAMFSDEFDKMLQPDIEEALKPIKKSLIKEFKDQFDRTARAQIRSQAEEAAKSFVAGVLTKQITKHQKKALEKAESAFLGRKAKSNEDENED